MLGSSRWLHEISLPKRVCHNFWPQLIPLAKNTLPTPMPTRNKEQHEFISITLFFTSLSKLCKNGGLKPFCWAKLACFDLSSSNFNLQHHILRTGGVASMKFNINFDVWMQPHWMKWKQVKSKMGMDGVHNDIWI